MKQKPLFVRIAWKVIFTISYPFITAFSFVFVWLIGLLSSISSLIVKIAKKIYPN